MSIDRAAKKRVVLANDDHETRIRKRTYSARVLARDLLDDLLYVPHAFGGSMGRATV